jgi:hypothetical protein
VLSWQVSNKLYADFRLAAFEQALARFGRPKISKIAQDSQFSINFTGALRDLGQQIEKRQPHTCAGHRRSLFLQSLPGVGISGEPLSATLEA